MKRIIFAALAVVGFAFSNVSARAQSANSNGAVIINDQFCNLVASDCRHLVLTSDSHEVLTRVDTSGNTMFKCKVKLGLPPPNGAVICDFENTGLPCITSSGGTNEWQETISASGQATLTCHINGATR